MLFVTEQRKNKGKTSMKEEKIYNCVCGKSFHNRNSLISHKATCKEWKAYKKQQEEIVRHERKAKQLPNGMFLCENPNCNKEHDGSYGSGRFCSKRCKQSFISKQQKIYPSAEQLKLRIGFGKQKRKTTWKCSECEFTFSTRSELRKHHKETGHITEEQNGKTQAWSRGLTAATSKSVSKCKRIRRQHFIEGKFHGSFLGRKHSDATKEKIRKSTANYIMNVVGSRPRYNKSSISILESIAKKHGWNIQHAENGGEFYTGIGYFVDAYDKEKNLVLEYDEPAHYIDAKNNVLREKDLIRQKNIIEHLQCEYWRYNSVTKILWKVEI